MGKKHAMDVVEIVRTATLLDIVLSDAEGGNLVSNEAGDRIVAELDALDPAIRLVRILSNGRDFCRGRVSPMPSRDAAVTGHDLKKRVAEPALRVYEAIRRARTPVMSVIRGAAYGYGCGLVAASDIAIASDSAGFQIPEMERGIPPTLVMTALLGRVPYKATAWLVLSRAIIPASLALEWGLVSRVVPEQELDAEVEAVTSSILAYPPEAVDAVKEFLLHARDLSGPAAASLAANLAGTALSARFTGGAR
jgi:enoyl-CoA hydratase/carnithine racemase